MKNNKIDIDINFDFTLDTPKYWDNYWKKDNVLGTFNNDPDSASKTLKEYHKELWSKQLPNGEMFNLENGSNKDYLIWNGMRFSSDSITASFRYKNNRKLLENVAKSIPDYQKFIENYIRKTYTIGGMIIFPKRNGGINQSRGCNIKIRDRWDLTLECIRKFYLGEESPLYDVLLAEKDFFELFIDFKGYIEFFYLQDCVSSDYKKVKFWLENNNFIGNSLPQNVEEYMNWIDKELDFVEKRNNRIKNQYSIKVM